MLFYRRPIYLKKAINIVEETTIPRLCKESGIRPRVLTNTQQRIVLIQGDQNYEFDGIKYVGIDGFSTDVSQKAKEVLEALAYGFFDYEAREIMAFHNEQMRRHLPRQRRRI